MSEHYEPDETGCASAVAMLIIAVLMVPGLFVVLAALAVP